MSVQAAVTRQKIIWQFASQGDCVMVGRCADVILRELHPMNLFVYANQQSKLERGTQRMQEGEKLSASALLRKMRQADKGRAAYHGLLTDSRWGQKEACHLRVNTSGREIRSLIPPLAEYVSCWLGKNTV